jgi:hypothetical protein
MSFSIVSITAEMGKPVALQRAGSVNGRYSMGAIRYKLSSTHYGVSDARAHDL